MKLYLRVEEGRVIAARFQTFGCGVAIACCSKLTEMATNRLVQECRDITSQQLEAGLAGLPVEKRFCAALAVEALRNGLNRMGGDGAENE